MTTVAWLDDRRSATAPEQPAATALLGTRPTGDVHAPGYGGEPQAFLVETPAPLRVHYHPVDQFQLFLGGAARFGPHEAGPGTAHYADAFTPYGPIEPHQPGVAFLTLRAVSDSGAWWMPESRDALAAGTDRRRHRNQSWDVSAPVPAGAWTTLAAEPDGLGVLVLELDPGSSAALPTIGGSGAYLSLLRGRLAGPVGAGALAWLPPGEHAIDLVAEEPARLALLQLPSSPRG